MINESNVVTLQELRVELIGHFTFCLEIPYYFSGNQMYKAQRTKSGKTWVRKEIKVWELQKLICSKITELNIKAPKNAFCYCSHIAFFFSKYDWITKNSSNLKEIDLTNLLKPVEDAIFGLGIRDLDFLGLEIDDSKGVYNVQSKCVLPEDFKTPPFYVAVDLTFYEKLG